MEGSPQTSGLLRDWTGIDAASASGVDRRDLAYGY